MFQLLYPLIKAIQPFLVPICFVSAWIVLLLFVWSLVSAAKDSVTTARQMHQIPCPGCAFFTNDYRLKCTVHPHIANSEAAINCLDYQSKTNPYLH